MPHHPARVDAAKRNLTRYSTGIPCEHGHMAERMVSSGQCIVCKSESRKRWHANHPGEEARWARERRAKDPSGHRAEVKRWREKNLERVSDTHKRFAERQGRAALNAAHKRWRDANLEHIRAYNAEKSRIRRGLRNINGGSYTPADIEIIQARQHGLCAVCGALRKLEVDHIVPITKGGTNDPSNIQLLCRSCNASKHAHDFEEWLARRVH